MKNTSGTKRQTKRYGIAVRPESWINKGFLAGWPVAWLRVACQDVDIDTVGTKSEIVARIATEIHAGNRRVIRRFDRCY